MLSSAGGENGEMQAAALAREVPVVEADRVRHDFADGWEEEVRPGITIMRLYRIHGPPGDQEKVVFHEFHFATFAYDGCVNSSKLSCVRDCSMRVRPLKI